MIAAVKAALPRGREKILDVGAGAGTYAHLLKGTAYRIHALEVFAPYVERFHLRDHYECVLLGDIRAFRPSTRYDLAILGDVLEHLTAAEAQALVARLPTIASQSLFSVPWSYEQGPMEGNDAEIHHQPDLTPETMRLRFPTLRPVWAGPIIGIYALDIAP